MQILTLILIFIYHFKLNIQYTI